MLTDLLLATVLGVGQAPAMPIPVANVPGQLPHGGMVLLMQPNGTPAPAPAQGHLGGVEAMPADPASEQKAEEGAEPAKKYLVMKTLEGSWLGDKLDKKGISIYGWSEASYTASSTRHSNLPMTTNDWANEFLNNQNYLVIEKAIDTEKKEVQLGWRMDWLFGTDYRFTLPRGLWNNQLTSNNGTPELYGVDLFQAYADLFLPNLGEGTTVRVGRFATPIGYELVQAVDTPFVSRSYNFQYNPFTHSGVFATTTLNDTWSMGNGFVLGADNFFNSNTSRLNYLGQLKWAPKDGDTSVVFNALITNPKYDVNEKFTQFNCYNMLFTHKLSDDLTYVLDTTVSHTYNVPDIGTAWWYGFANYFVKKHNDTLASTVRIELFDDVEGFRTGFKGLYTAATYGMTWNPTEAVLVRPGVRYDVNSQSSPFEGDNAMFTAWLDIIYRW